MYVSLKYHSALYTTPSTFYASPITIVVTGTIGIIVTSCGQEILGATLWEPFDLLGEIMDF